MIHFVKKSEDIFGGWKGGEGLDKARKHVERKIKKA